MTKTTTTRHHDLTWTALAAVVVAIAVGTHGRLGVTLGGSTAHDNKAFRNLNDFCKVSEVSILSRLAFFDISSQLLLVCPYPRGTLAGVVPHDDDDVCPPYHTQQHDNIC